MGSKFSLALSQASTVLRMRGSSASSVLGLAVGSTGRDVELPCETGTGQEKQLEPQGLSSSAREKCSPPPHTASLGTTLGYVASPAFR